MATLHGILAELGIEAPLMHPERQVFSSSDWINGEEFSPVEGKSYEIAYEKTFSDGDIRHLVKKIRINGPTPASWFDLDEGKPLDQQLEISAIKAFRPIA